MVEAFVAEEETDQLEFPPNCSNYQVGVALGKSAAAGWMLRRMV
jgi:hypothetical protein